GANSVAFPFSRLQNQFDVSLRIRRDDAFDLLAGIVGRLAFYKNDLGASPECRNSFNGGGDIPAFVAAWNYDRTRQWLHRRFLPWTSGDHAHQSETAKSRQIYQEPVTKCRQQRNINRKKKT